MSALCISVCVYVCVSERVRLGVVLHEENTTETVMLSSYLTVSDRHLISKTLVACGC